MTLSYRTYMKRIQDVIGKTKSADKIEENTWFDRVLRELNEISKQCALELEKETGSVWDKGSYKLQLHEAPPIRFLAVELALASWLGWIMNEKHKGLFSAQDCWNRLKEAYDFGVSLSQKHEVP